MSSSKLYDTMSTDNWDRRVFFHSFANISINSSFRECVFTEFTNEMLYCKQVDSVVCKKADRVDTVARSDMGRKEHTYRTKSPFVSVQFIAVVLQSFTT
jgi:hypothetical protein